MKPRQFSIRCTSRFAKHFDRAQPLLRACVAGALADLKRAFSTRPDLALKRYDMVEGIRSSVLEIDISNGERLLAHWRDGILYLLDVGNHDITGHYQQTGVVSTEIKKCVPLPAAIARLTAAPFFTFNVKEEWQNYASETEPSWLSFLDRQQATVVARIVKRLANPTVEGDWYFAMVAGGPGTGKTSVLLSLFERGFECDLMPQIIVEDQVAEYVQSSVRIDLSPYRVSTAEAGSQSQGGLLLVDDPRSASVIEHARWLAQSRRYRAVVVAVDPLQLLGAVEDANFYKFDNPPKSELFQLNVCYRQKSAVGEATKRTLESLAASSPYYRQDKKESFAAARQQLTALANTLDFPNKGGTATVIMEPTIGKIRELIDGLVNARGLWRHWSPYLVAFDDFLRPLPRSWRQELNRLARRQEIQLDDAVCVKGVEFQHAVLFISYPLFLQLEHSFEGATKNGFEARKLLRIPISRAKDSVTVIVCTGM